MDGESNTLLPVILRCDLNRLHVPGTITNRCPDVFPVESVIGVDRPMVQPSIPQVATSSYSNLIG